MLSFKFAILVIVAGVAVFGLYLAWSFQAQRAAMESQVLAEARVLDLEMNAAWDYITSIQDQINYTNGEYDFKNVYCSVAGKSIALRFTRDSDYVIRYARENPRSGTDEPDGFESRALSNFLSEGIDEYYETTEFDGKPAFRYASSLLIENDCLRCHGDPVGEYDETGFIKEGMKLGELAGAASIVIPLDRYREDVARNIISSSIFFCMLMVVVTFIIWFALRRWVTDPMISDNERLHSENEAQSNFLTVMSHELRTPLSSIIAFTDIWKRTAQDKSVEESRLVEEVEANSKLLLGMVNNTLDTARFDEGKLKTTMMEVDVVDEVNAVKAVMGPLARKKGIDFVTHVSGGIPILISDQEALHKILLNLVGNAMKFTPSGGWVCLDVTYEGGILRYDVSDNGVGIAPEGIAMIFDRFVRLDTRGGSKEHGAGLGLSLVKALVDLLQGSIEVESQQGKGSVFSVKIPAKSCPWSEEE